MLYCVTCKSMVEEGSALCGVCKNGFVSSLACGTCQKVAPKGLAYCPNCARGSGSEGYSSMVPQSHHRDRWDPRQPQGRQGETVALVLPKLPPGISLERIQVSDSYAAGSFGAQSEVQMNGRDSEILTKMNQVAVLLLALGQEMNDLCALSESTRKVVKGCRNLAADIQEEVEVRVGRQR